METLWAVEKRLRLWGVTSKLRLFLLRVPRYVAFVCFSGCLARSWVCWFACIVVLLYGLLYHLPAGFLVWKGLLEVMGFFV